MQTQKGSLSADIQMRLEKEEIAADLAVQSQQTNQQSTDQQTEQAQIVKLYLPKEEKLQILGAVLDLVELNEICIRQNLEAPWSALLGHAFSMVGRDLLTKNVDLRWFLGLKNACAADEDYYQVKRDGVRGAVVIFIERMLNGVGCFK